MVSTAISSKRVGRILVYSTSEIDTYERLFPKAKGKFRYVPFPILAPIKPSANCRRASDKFVAIGKSNRDYRLLAELFRGRPETLEIICHGLKIDDCPENVKIVDNCFGQQMYDKIAEARAVLIALKNPDISSGQMVALQAQQLGTPVIATDIDGLKDYITSGENGILVSNDLESWRAALKAVGDQSTWESLVAEGRKRVAERHSLDAFAKNAAQAILDS